jgi:hypothetical protein
MVPQPKGLNQGGQTLSVMMVYPRLTGAAITLLSFPRRSVLAAARRGQGQAIPQLTLFDGDPRRPKRANVADRKISPVKLAPPRQKIVP